MGVFYGRPLTADRLKAFPVASLTEFRSWVEKQAEIICDNPFFTFFDGERMGEIARGLGAIAPQFFMRRKRGIGPLDRDGLAEWLESRSEVLLVSLVSVFCFNQNNGRPIFFTFDGRKVTPTDGCLFVDLNPLWLYPRKC